MVKTIANQPSPSQVVGKLSECFRRLEQAGLDLDDLQAVIDDPTMRVRLVRYWKAGARETHTYQETTSQLRVRERIPRNFIGINEVMQQMNVIYADPDLATLAEVPEALLADWCDDDLVFPGFPLTVQEMFRRHPDLFAITKEEGGRKELYRGHHGFIKEVKVELRWYRIRKIGVKYYRSQHDLNYHEGNLEQGKCRVASIAPVTFMALMYRLLTGEWLFEQGVRCREERERAYFGFHKHGNDSFPDGYNPSYIESRGVANDVDYPWDVAAEWKL